MMKEYVRKMKISATLFGAVLGILILVSGNTEIKADTVGTITPAYMKSMDAYDSTVKLSYEHKFDMPGEMNNKEKSDIIKVVIPRDSIVRMDYQFYEGSDSPDFMGMSWGYVEVYTNQILSDKILSKMCNCGSQESPKTGKVLISLKKGTYYVKVIAHRNWYTDKSESIYNKLFLTGISTKDALAVTAKKTSKDAYKLNVKSNLGAELNNIYYEKGIYHFEKNDYSLKGIGAGAGSVKVSGEGQYSVVFAFGDATSTFDLNPYNSVVLKVNLDKTKPVITGVKNGKTYRQPVIVKFSDKGSGIKAAKLNGKSVKSGKKITQNGSYTLIVTDKSGNKSTVKFIIKNKK